MLCLGDLIQNCFHIQNESLLMQFRKCLWIYSNYLNVEANKNNFWFFPSLILIDLNCILITSVHDIVNMLIILFLTFLKTCWNNFCILPMLISNHIRCSRQKLITIVALSSVHKNISEHQIRDTKMYDISIETTFFCEKNVTHTWPS